MLDHRFLRNLLRMTSPAKSQSYTRHRAAFAALVTALIVAAIAFSSGRVSSQGSEPQRRDLERVFKQHERLSLDPGQIARQVKQTRSLTLNTSRGTFEMTLEPHDMRAPGYVAEAWSDKGVRVLERGPVRTYKGTVKGLPAAQARMTIDEETVEGLIITPNELLFLEPVKRYSKTAAKTDFVFYAGSDVKEPAGECGTTMAQMVAQHSTSVSNQTSAKGPQPEAVFGPALEIGIAAEADFEYFSVFGTEAATVNQIETIMFEVEGIYNAHMGLQFLLLHTRVWTTASDPYTSPVAPATTVDPGTALTEFRSYYNANAPAGAAGRDIAHLWTGRDIRVLNSPSNTIGIAFQPGMDCPFDSQGQGSFAYGISEHIDGNRAGLSAHEIGHNFGASHVTSDQGSDCGDPGSTTTTSIMNARISSSTNFCQFSRDEITGHAIATGDCLTPLTQPGCTYSISPTLQDLPRSSGGGSVTVTPNMAGCNWAVAEGKAWLTVTSGASGTGSGTVNYSVTANDGICGPRRALVSIGGQILTVRQAGKPDYLTDPAIATAIAPGQTINGDLSAPDCATALSDENYVREDAFMDRYKFNGMAGQKIRIEMNATGALDTFLYLYGPDGTRVAQNDDIVLTTQTNSRIPCNTPCNTGPPGLLTLDQTGTYIIIATSYSSGDTGGYSLTLTSEPLLLTAQVTDSVGTAAALNSVTFARTSNPENTAFRIFDPHNFSADQTTRLILFTSDFGLPSQQNPSPTGPNALLVSAGGQDLLVENVGPFTFPGLNGSYVVVALKQRNGQPMLTGHLVFTVTCRGLTSNQTTITIAP
jgi:hypothetical protein